MNEKINCNKNLESSIEFDLCSYYKRELTGDIVIWGTGAYGKLVFKLLSNFNHTSYNVVSFCNSNLESKYSSLEGISVLSVSEAISLYPNATFFLANSYLNEIRKYIADNGWKIKLFFSEYRFRSSEQYLLSISKNKTRNFGKDFLTFGSFKCNLCESKIPYFVNASAFGLSPREKGFCPNCFCLDRERFLFYVLQKYTSIFSSKSGNILHFAPEFLIQNAICQSNKNNYITADIEKDRADEVVDITCIQYGDKTFDFIICNHVLEHIENETRAFHELKRCLKDDGIIIFSVPINWYMLTYEDKSIKDPKQREIAFGQKDHVRQYGYDIVERIHQYGFKFKIIKVKEEFSLYKINKFGFYKEDSIFILSKS